MAKVAIVSGGSGGIGRASALLLAREAWKVYEFSRSGLSGEGIVHLAADVSDRASVEKAVGEVIKAEGHIDLLVNNAGMGVSGPAEFTSDEDVRRIMDVNFIGQLNCARAVLPQMRAQKSGRIVALSSVAAPIAIPYQAFYSASKAAVSSLALALRNEVRDFGIEVAVVMPGDASTGFTDARKKCPGGEIYPKAEAAVGAMERDERSGMSPEQVARVVYKAATDKNPKPLYTAGFKYKFFVMLFKLLPARAAYRIVGKMYS
ncbi:MAG: SDR family NAD(P)-dependent oxidoreductase [Oscillospiraceae bacterium]|nr:SDR family NAD(P)-dependent oxidoreductase [Oscillospiraceae bacterium]